MLTQRNDNDNELRAFILILRRALLMIVRWIEKTYEENHDST